MKRSTNTRIIISTPFLMLFFICFIVIGDKGGLANWTMVFIPFFLISIFLSIAYGVFARFGSWTYHNLLSDPHWRESATFEKQEQQMRTFYQLGLHVEDSREDIRALAHSRLQPRM